MKILFFSDVHGVPSTLEQLFQQAEKLQPDRFVLLGDALYHGPRNGVPDFYDPVKVAQLLNANKEKILAVRGNCDSEVDQMMLEFPITADYAELVLPEKHFFLTHGHLWNAAHLPPLKAGAVLVHGHTHVPLCCRHDDGISIFNPGSISLPKGGSARSFGFWDGASLTVRALESGEILPVC